MHKIQTVNVSNANRRKGELRGEDTLGLDPRIFFSRAHIRCAIYGTGTRTYDECDRIRKVKQSMMSNYITKQIYDKVEKIKVKNVLVTSHAGPSNHAYGASYIALATCALAIRTCYPPPRFPLRSAACLPLCEATCMQPSVH
jgi:hypothetical protein